MAIGLLANSRNALIFAGGVIACAALVAISLGSEFTARTNGSDESEQIARSPEQSPAIADAGAPGGAAEPSDAYDSGAQEPGSVFGEFDSFADDGFSSEADLIDTTEGFDPEPSENLTITTDVEPETGTATGTGTGTGTPVRGNSGAQNKSGARARAGARDASEERDQPDRSGILRKVPGFRKPGQ